MSAASPALGERTIRYDQRALLGAGSPEPQSIGIGCGDPLAHLPVIEVASPPLGVPSSDSSPSSGLGAEEETPAPASPIRWLHAKWEALGDVARNAGSVRALAREQGMRHAASIVDAICAEMWGAKPSPGGFDGAATLAARHPRGILAPRGGSRSGLRLEDLDELLAMVRREPNDASRCVFAMHPSLLEEVEREALAGGRGFSRGVGGTEGSDSPRLDWTAILACPRIPLDENGEGTTSVYALRFARQGEDWRSASGVARLRAADRPEIYATAPRLTPNRDDVIFEFEVWGNAGIAGGGADSVAQLSGVLAAHG